MKHIIIMNYINGMTCIRDERPISPNIKKNERSATKTVDKIPLRLNNADNQ